MKLYKSRSTNQLVKMNRGEIIPFHPESCSSQPTRDLHRQQTKMSFLPICREESSIFAFSELHCLLSELRAIPCSTPSGKVIPNKKGMSFYSRPTRDLHRQQYPKCHSSRFVGRNPVFSHSLNSIACWLMKSSNA